ncbi:MAG: TldD/PmbA family protein [Clostridia bacterium]|nr:TldD/PmbA family protein [Clostridia bacterium]
MKLEKIIELVKASGADAWEITDTREEGWEFYFIRRKLDQNRLKLVEHIRVTVYKKSADGQFLGSAGGEIAPTADEDEARRVIAGLLKNAAYVRNPAYTLNKPARDVQAAPAASVDPAAIAKDFIEAVRSVPETETEDINSWELFVSAERCRFVNSEGIDVESVYPSSTVEVIINARRDGREIELYRLYESGGCDRNALVNDISETMRFGKDKLLARNTPNLGKADVVFSTDAALEIYDWFALRMNAAFKVRGLSDWEAGKPVVEGATGDRVTLTAVRQLPNSSLNMAYDDEGAPVRETVLIEDGVAKRFLGNRQFSQYMGLEESFQPGNLTVAGGSCSAEALRAGRFLEVVEFSDFQVNPVNGDIAGEIRLAYWHDGDTVTPVSGGSVTGTMAELARTMRMSRETRQYDCRVIPAVTRLQGVTVTGAM